jgi:integrase
MTRPTTMLELAEEFLAFRRRLGYELVAEGYLLREFGRFADASHHQGPITNDLVLRWVRSPPNATTNYLTQRFLVVRRLARYRALFDPRTEIPADEGLKLRRVQPHIFTERQMAELMTAAVALPPAQGLRPQTYSTLFGLLVSTGLRVGEALRLERDEADLTQGVLRVSNTKFGKSRMVPVHDSTRKALHRYAAFRDQRYPTAATRAFFLSENGTPLNYDRVQKTFVQLRQRLGWSCSPGRRAPRIHDLRRTFACHRLLQWYREGIDVGQAILALSTYLGHTTVACTYWYLTGTPELLGACAARFQQFAGSPRGGAS